MKQAAKPSGSAKTDTKATILESELKRLAEMRSRMKDNNAKYVDMSVSVCLCIFLLPWLWMRLRACVYMYHSRHLSPKPLTTHSILSSLPVRRETSGASQLDGRIRIGHHSAEA